MEGEGSEGSSSMMRKTLGCVGTFSQALCQVHAMEWEWAVASLCDAVRQVEATGLLSMMDDRETGTGDDGGDGGNGFGMGAMGHGV
jgi:hypothetical protein